MFFKKKGSAENQKEISSCLPPIFLSEDIKTYKNIAAPKIHDTFP